MPRSRESYLRNREQIKKISRQKHATLADIGKIPAVVNPARREACRLDLLKYLVTYFPNSTGLKPFSPSHIEAIKRIESCILSGGLFGQAFPRGAAKTTISENAVLWAAKYGHRRFPVLFGADANAAAGNLDSIKTELAENDLLLEDFPEVCFPIRALEGKPQRCASQTHIPGNFESAPDARVADGGPKKRNRKGKKGDVEARAEDGEGAGEEGAGQLTHIAWTADTIILPTIRYADGTSTPSSGAIIATRGIESGSRGLKHKRPDGTQQRPDLVLLDDPQTDKSAATPAQVEKRGGIIRKNILKLGGHNRAIAFVMNATVIKKADLVEQMMNPKLWPALQSVRIKMVTKWAEAHETLWLTDYARIRNTYDPDILGDQQRAHKEATEFYRRNREKMDAGCEVFWEHCFAPDTELSAIQHAYNMLIDDGEEVFASECQNEPLEEESTEKEQLRADAIAEKVNGSARGVIPAGANRLTIFIDPKKAILYWVALATGEHFDGYVVDYGVYPEQPRNYFAARDVRKTLALATKSDSMEAAVYAGLDRLVNVLMDRQWKREDGAEFKPDRILIDANWGEASETIYKFVRQSRHAAILLPSHGKYVGAKSRAFSEYQRKDGDRVGSGWRMPAGKGKRFVLFDTNHWKTFVADRWRTAMGGLGCLSLFGSKSQKAGGGGEQHRLFADHQVSERGISVEANGRRVTEWQLKPGQPDNDYFDCVVGCHVGASVMGASLLDGDKPVVRQRVSLADMAKRAKHMTVKR